MDVLTSPETYRVEPEQRLGAAEDPRAQAEGARRADRGRGLARARGADPRRAALARAQGRRASATSPRRRRPRSSSSASLRSLPKGFERSRWGEAIVEAVQRGLARDPKTLPRLERFRPAPNGAATVELLKVLLRMTAESHGVAAKVIATVDDLDRIAADDEADVPALKGWRRELFGEKALALKHGQLALAVERGRVVTVESGGEPFPNSAEQSHRTGQPRHRTARRRSAPSFRRITTTRRAPPAIVRRNAVLPLIRNARSVAAARTHAADRRRSTVERQRGVSPSSSGLVCSSIFGLCFAFFAVRSCCSVWHAPLQEIAARSLVAAGADAVPRTRRCRRAGISPGLVSAGCLTSPGAMRLSRLAAMSSAMPVRLRRGICRRSASMAAAADRSTLSGATDSETLRLGLRLQRFDVLGLACTTQSSRQIRPRLAAAADPAVVIGTAVTAWSRHSALEPCRPARPAVTARPA